MRQLPLAVRLRERARFANFVRGPNDAALAAAQGMSAGERGVCLLTGPASSGKSHLLLAAMADAERRGRTASYFALRELGAGAASALHTGRATQLVCCDDIDWHAQDAEFGRALFALWREQEEQGGALLLAARTPLAAQRWALADFASRLRGMAQHVLLQPLADSDVHDVLAQRARDCGLEMSADVLDYLLRRLPRDLATLVTTIENLDQAALTAQRRLTIPFVRQLLAEQSDLFQSDSDVRDPPA